MNKQFLLSVTALLLSMAAISQVSPQWTQIINPFPAVHMFPPISVVATGTDVAVLTHDMVDQGMGDYLNGWIVTSYDGSGGVNWTQSLSPFGTEQVSMKKMVADDAGNLYIAGQEVDQYDPVLVKLDNTGAIVWQLDTITNTVFGGINDIEIRNNELYITGFGGSAKLDTAGNEIWVTPYGSSECGVSHAGDMVVSGYSGNDLLLFLINNNGNVNVIDSNINVERITFDQDDNIYILGYYYEVMKYNSNGVHQWTINNLTSPPPFGDIGMEILADHNNNIWLIGINDTIYKLDTAGVVHNLIPMNGLDSYRVSAILNTNNTIYIAGSVPAGTIYACKIIQINDTGSEIWSGYHSAANATTQFTAGIAAGQDGLFVISNVDQHTEVNKYQLSQGIIDICVDSVWYDPQNPNIINVSVNNNSSFQINYPSVQIISPAGDTIGNPGNAVQFFAQVPNTNTIYTDSITVQGITDFSGYTFIMYESFGSYVATMSPCIASSVAELNGKTLVAYPNPVHSFLRIEGAGQEPYIISTESGTVAATGFCKNGMIDFSLLPAGFYIVQLMDSGVIKVVKTD